MFRLHLVNARRSQKHFTIPQSGFSKNRNRVSIIRNEHSAMSKDSGYLAYRRGIWEHVRDGRLSLQDVAVHAYISSQADTRTGIWHGSAGALAGELCISKRLARRFLERLSKGDYIKRFPIPGRHICYPILIHKFLLTDGEHKGEHLNALASTSPIDLRYFPGQQEGQQKGQHVSPQKRIENREERKNHAAKPAPPADPRFQPFLEFAYGAFEAKHGQKPTWTGKDFKALSALLSGNKGLGADELQRRFRNFLSSTEPFTQKQGDALGYFCAHVDSFLAGPILALPQKGASNGKPTATDLAIQNARVLGLGRPN